MKACKINNLNSIQKKTVIKPSSLIFVRQIQRHIRFNSNQMRTIQYAFHDQSSRAAHRHHGDPESKAARLRRKRSVRNSFCFLSPNGLAY